MTTPWPTERHGYDPTSFLCDSNQLTSLYGSPEEIYGSFDCPKNCLTSLIGGPKRVHGSYSCVKNKIESLEGFPEYLAESFYCSRNKLKNLKHINSHIHGSLSCDLNLLETFEYFPQIIKENLDIMNNNINFETQMSNFNTSIGKYIFSDYIIDSHGLNNDYIYKINTDLFLSKVTEIKVLHEKEILLSDIYKAKDNNIHKKRL